MFLSYNMDVEKKSVWKIANPSSEAANYPFIVNESGVFYAKSEFFTMRYAKNDYQILYTVSGAADLEYNGEKLRLGEGSMVVINCNEYHDYRTALDAGHWTYYWVHVSGEYCKRYYDTIYKNGFKLFAVGKDSEITAYFTEAIRQIDYTTDAAYMRLSGMASALFTRLIMQEDSSLPSAQEEVVRQAVDIIHRGYMDSICIDDIAKKLNLSKFYFVKLFCKHTGMTPYNYLIRYRIGEAKKLLRATDYKIADIAEAVGFSDTSNFSRTFTKLVGITPGKYK